MITQEEFRVVPIPPPYIFLADSTGNKLNLERPVKGKYLNVLRLRAIPDPTFKVVVPEEAKYEIIGAVLTQFREGGSISNTKIETKNEEGDILIDIGKLDLERGDGFNLKVLGANRINKNGQIEAVPILRPNIQFTIAP